MRALWLTLFILVGACKPEPAAPQPPSTSTRPTVDKYECQRCHLGMKDVTPVALDKTCTGCHLGIKNGAFDEFWPESTITEWKSSIRHLLVIPSLQHVETRLRRDWFIEFVQNPHDLRPRLEETMPRLKISAADAELLADELGFTEDFSNPKFGDAERGKALFRERGCLSCHHLGGALPTGDFAAGNAPNLAPDLSFVRRRFRRDALVSWLDNPKAMKPDTLMPDLLNQAEAADVAAFLMQTQLIEAPKNKPPIFLPKLTREVGFNEVNQKVFSKICLHCHGDQADTFAEGDGGPGNTGGFGFPAKNVDFSTEARALSAAPRVVSHLKARHAEVRGVIDPDVRGMPLGLPPLSLTDIQLIETWAADASSER